MYVCTFAELEALSAEGLIIDASVHPVGVGVVRWWFARIC